MRTSIESAGVGCFLTTVLTACVFVAAWFTHVIVCIKTASWVFLLAGAICFPIAIVHGIGIWFNVW